MSVDLGGGLNTLTLDSGANTGTVKNIDTLIGGAGTDTITIGNAANNASISLGAGSDTLTFGIYANSATVANVATILGTGGTDTITLASNLTDAMEIDLGGGSNKLTLGRPAATPAR